MILYQHEPTGLVFTGQAAARAPGWANIWLVAKDGELVAVHEDNIFKPTSYVDVSNRAFRRAARLARLEAMGHLCAEAADIG